MAKLTARPLVLLSSLVSRLSTLVISPPAPSPDQTDWVSRLNSQQRATITTAPDHRQDARGSVGRECGKPHGIRPSKNHPGTVRSPVSNRPNSSRWDRAAHTKSPV